jgi:hypothetical protein
LNDDQGLSKDEVRALRRAAACWQNDRPSALAAARARRRWMRREAPALRPISRAALAALAVGSLVSGVALGLSGGMEWARLTPAVATAQAPAPSAPVHRVPHRAGGAPSARSAASVTFAQPPPDAEPAPAPTHRQPSSSGPTLEPPMERDDADAVGAWSRAAQALRTGDEPQALRALDELGRNVDPTTRDAAQLARAQLDARGGRVESAAPVLRHLSEAGATPLIRRRAAEVLKGLDASK